MSFGPGGPVDLGEDLERCPALALQCIPEHLLGGRVRVGVGGVERRDARIERRVNTPGGGVVLHLGAVGEPVAVNDLRDLEAAVAEVSEFHTGNATPFLGALSADSGKLGEWDGRTARIGG